jgi:hypothetical protein
MIMFCDGHHIKEKTEEIENSVRIASTNDLTAYITMFPGPHLTFHSSWFYQSADGISYTGVVAYNTMYFSHFLTTGTEQPS